MQIDIDRAVELFKDDEEFGLLKVDRLNHYKISRFEVYVKDDRDSRRGGNVLVFGWVDGTHEWIHEGKWRRDFENEFKRRDKADVDKKAKKKEEEDARIAYVLGNYK